MIISESYKFLRMNMSGMYEIAFLPYAGGLLDQDAQWVDDIQTILSCLNRK